jgi:hypothetical protein
VGIVLVLLVPAHIGHGTRCNIKQLGRFVSCQVLGLGHRSPVLLSDGGASKNRVPAKAAVRALGCTYPPSPVSPVPRKAIRQRHSRRLTISKLGYSNKS